ncbi:MAG: DUF4332 domain-containing protein [Candidatus Thorarchaeota archaeon]
MDNDSFRDFLTKKKKKSKSAAESIIEILDEYDSYLVEEGIAIDVALPNDLDQFVLWVENDLGEKANRRLWGISVLYEFLEQSEMARYARSLRGKRIKPTPFLLAKFRGVNKEYVNRLEQLGILNVNQMIERGNTPAKRRVISKESGIPLDSVLEFVKLSDLTRIGAVRAVRARLYHDSGVDTIDKMARYDPIELRSYLQKWIENTRFDGIAPLPKEAANAVKAAKRLPRLVEYE